MAQPKFNSNDVLQMLIDKANENGYTLIINGTKDDALQIAVYPFRGTIVSNEEIARLLYDVIEKNGVTEDTQTFPSSCRMFSLMTSMNGSSAIPNLTARKMRHVSACSITRMSYSNI